MCSFKLKMYEDRFLDCIVIGIIRVYKMGVLLSDHFVIIAMATGFAVIEITTDCQESDRNNHCCAYRSAELVKSTRRT